MKSKKLTSAAWRMFFLGAIVAVPYAAAAPDLVSIATALGAIIAVIMPIWWVIYAAKTGYDIISARGTVQAVEIPWARLSYSGAFMVGAPLLAAGLGLF